MNITYDEFKKTDLYGQFAVDNPDIGILKINAYTASEGYPSSNTNISIYKKIGDYNVLFYSGMTDANGVIDNIVLPAPPGINDVLEAPKYTIYDLDATRTGFVKIIDYKIGMIGGVNVIQYINMVPEVNLNV